MSLLLATNIKRHFGAREVLRGLELRVEQGEKLGLVGRNGDGKTTLLRILEGEEQADAGKVELGRGLRLGYVSQRPSFAPGQSVWQYVESGMEEAHTVARELATLEHEMSSAQGELIQRLMARHGELTHRMEFLGGWESDRRVSTVLSGIGLPEPFWPRAAATLSGGEKSRTLLARELVSSPDVLLLDEPTNHLDLEGIEWLEAYVRELKGAVLIVSHDRRLLDRSVMVVLELERGLLKRFPGNYSTYVAIKEERHASELRAWEIQQDFLRKEEEFIRRHMGSQRTAEAKGRQKKLENLARLERPYNDVRRPVIRMNVGERSGELILEAVDLVVGHAGKPVVSDVNLRIGRGERIGIVGANGSGKTTLLRVLAGHKAPIAGSATPGHKTICGYFDQETAELAGSGAGGPQTPYECVQRPYPQMTDLEIRSHLARFLFRGEAVGTQLVTLSGGERARLALALLVLEQPNWLALDEPTNHLDLAARTALEEFLSEFDGTLVTISHDRAFLDALCTSILEIRAGRARLVRGNYTAWRELVQREKEEEQADKLQKSAAESARAAAQAAKLARGEPRASTVRSDGGKPKNPWLLKKVEESIIALEAEKEGLVAVLATEEYFRNPPKLRDAQIRLAEIERELEEKNAEWERWI